MEINGLKLIGSALIVSGLMAGTFLAGSMTTGTSADPAPTPGYTVEEDPIATPTPITEDEGGVPEYEVKEDEPQQLSQTTTQAQEQPQQQPQQPEEEQTPAQSPSPVVGTPVSATPVPPAPEPQNDAPYVVSILPSDGAIGVAVDANIVLHFSESMDKASVQAAFNLSTGNCGVFAWNSEATKVTFNPCNDFAYGTVVEVELYETAADKQGLGMDEEFESSFRVLRQTTTKIYSEESRDGFVWAPGLPAVTENHANNHEGIMVSNITRGFLSFELNQLPDDLLQITAASVHAKQVYASPAGYGTKNMLIQSVVYGTLTKSDWGLQAKPLCSLICLSPAPTSKVFVSNFANGWKSVDMAVAVRADWKLRVERNFRSGFRLMFENDCSGPNCGLPPQVGFYPGESEQANRPYLEVTYIHP